MKCPPWMSWLALVIGVLYLLADLEVFSALGNIQWYTVAFILAGLVGVSCKK